MWPEPSRLVEITASAFTILSVLGSVLWGSHRLLTRPLRKRLQKSQQEVLSYKKMADESYPSLKAANERLNIETSQLRLELEVRQAELTSSNTRIENTTKDLLVCQQQVFALQKQNEEKNQAILDTEKQVKLAEEQRQKTEEENEELRRAAHDFHLVCSRVRRSVNLQGQLWKRRVRQGDQESFVPLDRRNNKLIVAVLNLKGGVGKTLVTQCLTAAGILSGRRTLVVDADLQGSFSESVLRYEGVTKLSKEKTLLQHFIHRRFRKGGKVTLLPYVQNIHKHFGLVATADSLSAYETTLTLQWMVEGRKDPRFLIRRGIHGLLTLKQATPDLVIVDCPPVLNLTCLGVLAAADRVLIPINPSQRTIDRVPQLLYVIRSLQNEVNPHLDLMGVLMNRSHNGERLTEQERSYVDYMRNVTEPVWKQKVNFLDCLIPNSVPLKRALEELNWYHLEDTTLASVAQLLVPEFAQTGGTK